MDPKNAIRSNRVRGFILIVNTLAPVVIAALIAFFGMWVGSKVAATYRESVSSAERILAGANAAKQQVVLAAEQAVAEAAGAVESGKAIARRIDTATTTIRTESKNAATGLNNAVNEITKPLPKVGHVQRDARRALKKFFSPVTTPFTTIGNQFSAVGKDIEAIQNRMAKIAELAGSLDGLEVYLDTIITEYTVIQENARRSLAWVKTAGYWTGIIIILVVAWVAFCYFFTFLENLRLGWKLALGR